MEKIKKHFQDNALIYLVLITCIIISSIVIYVNRNPVDTEAKKIDKSLFEIVNVDQALDLFNHKGAYYLVMGVDDCSATISYAETLKYEMIKMNFPVYYLDLNSISKDDIDTYNEFANKLDLEYNFQNEKGTFGDFIGSTPMTAIISNKKQVYGFIGSLNGTTIESLANLYSLSVTE